MLILILFSYQNKVLFFWSFLFLLMVLDSLSGLYLIDYKIESKVYFSSTKMVYLPIHFVEKTLHRFVCFSDTLSIGWHIYSTGGFY